MSDTARLPREIAPAALILVAGTYALTEASRMTAFGAIFPQFAGGTMMAGSLVLIVRALFFRSDDQSTAPPVSGRAWMLAVVLFAWAIAMPVFGFVITSFLGAACALAVSLDRKPTLRSLVLQGGGTAVFILAVAYVFSALLNIPLP